MAGDIDLTGMVAIVTGGGAGIGRGIVEALARHGADIAIAEVDPDRAAQAAAAVEGLGRRPLTVLTNAMDTAQVREAVTRAHDQFGRLDILVNNAGGVRGRPFLEQSEASWRRHIDLNLVSALAATAAAAPLMARHGRGGSIINVATIEAARAAPMYAVYAACKAAMVSFTRTMALELAEERIRVNAIAPDRTRTPGLLGMMAGPVPDPLPAPSESEQADVRSQVPLGREGDISECGELVAFLSSGQASYITGTVIPIDGGTWAASGWFRGRDGKWRLYDS
jgi:NAD(P)-dependent dehydrogenase (short-subunit alcohol dehydrogenase family)